MPITFFVEVLEQLVTGQVAAVFDNTGQSAVVDIGFVTDPMLSAKAQMDAAALDIDMSVAPCRQTVALVRFSIFGIADAKERHLHQTNNGGKHSLARQPAAR
jgi:hypothetical protein